MDNEKITRPEPNKIITITIIILLIAAGIAFYKIPKYKSVTQTASIVQNQQIQIKLEINTGVQVYEFKETAEKDISVFDLLRQASQKEGFALSYRDSSMGAFIDGIYSVKNDTNNNKFWLFSVNGQPSNIGASSYKLSNGDIVEWTYAAM